MKMLNQFIKGFAGSVILVGSFLLYQGLFLTEAQAKNTHTRTYIGFDSHRHTTGVHATGIGYAPTRRALSVPQRRLLAKRAAVVDGYRQLAKTLNYLPSEPKKGIIRDEFSGFIRGVQVGESRFYSNGKVEVDLFFPLSEEFETFKNARTFFSTSRVPVCEVIKQKTYISKEEYDVLFRPKK